MKTDKFKACGFVELRPRDKYYGAEIIDKHGKTHKVIGKRGDWLIYHRPGSDIHRQPA